RCLNGIVHDIHEFVEITVIPFVRHDARMAWMTPAENHGMTWAGFRRRVTVVCLCEDGAPIEKHLQAAFIERSKARQIIKTHLIDGKNQDELGLARRTLTETV